MKSITLPINFKLALAFFSLLMIAFSNAEEKLLLSHKMVLKSSIPKKNVLNLKCDYRGWIYKGRSVKTKRIHTILSKKEFVSVFVEVAKDAPRVSSDIVRFAQLALNSKKSFYVKRMRGSIDSQEWCREYFYKAERRGVREGF